MTYSKTTFAALLLGAAVLAGCRLPPRNSGAEVSGGRVTVFDPSFAVNIELERESFTTTPEGFLRVQTTVRNTNHEDWACQYRFVWFDADGLEQTHAATPERSCVLRGRQATVLEAVSPLAGTKDFRLELRPVAR